MNYDDFQKKAIQEVINGHSVIVCAPTGAGKTAIAEYVIEKCISDNQGVIYTAPIKALSNQKFRDFSRVYEKHIGILTGDVSLNTHAPVLIMTTEIFRNTLLENPQRLTNISWVIFDEVHYIDDLERGTVWEESIIFCPPHIRILALSATIPDAVQIASWIRKIHSYPVATVIEKKRPVPLQHCFQAQNKIFSNTSQLHKHVYTAHTLKPYRRKQYSRPAPNRITQLLHYLQENKRMPVIYFSFSRKRCESLAHETKTFNFLDSEDRNKITLLFEKLLSQFDLKNEPSAVRLWPLIKRGIAYHHAGLLPSMKEVIERLFTSRLIKLIFTTETFALGINMPAKTVVFDELRKFYGYYHAHLRCRDYYQMAGRAGRRGIDKEGFVYSRINPHRTKFALIKKIISGEPEPITSQFNLSYASLLHLYGKWREELYKIYPLTLHFFQSSKKSRKNALSLMHRKIELLKELRYIHKHTLTHKGTFASSVYGYELLLTELFSTGFLEELSSIELNIVLAALVFEPRKNQLHAKVPKKLTHIRTIVADLADSIIRKEKKRRIRSLSRKPYFNLALAMEQWSYGESFLKTKAQTTADAGEIVRYFRMVIQILRQLRSIPLVCPVFKKKIVQSLTMIKRNEVDAEKQLREGL